MPATTPAMTTDKATTPREQVDVVIPKASSPKKILVIRLSALGDVVLTSPAIRLLQARFPNAEIHWLTEKPYAPMVSSLCGAHALAYDKRGADRGLKGLIHLRKKLLAENYDLVVDLQNKPKTALLRTVGKRAIAFQKRSFSEAIFSLFWTAKPLDRCHTTQAFAEALRPLDIALPEDADELAQCLTPSMTLASAPTALEFTKSAPFLVGISPGARWETKRWPVENFGELARRFESLGAQILLVGGPSDRSAFDAIRTKLSAPEKASDTAEKSVVQLCHAIAKCDLVITGDSGPAHIAAALGIPTLTLFGPTSVRRWAPRGKWVDVATNGLSCSPCSNYGTPACPLKTHACLKNLSVETVFSKAVALAKRAETWPSSF